MRGRRSRNGSFCAKPVTWRLGVVRKDRSGGQMRSRWSRSPWVVVDVPGGSNLAPSRDEQGLDRDEHRDGNQKSFPQCPAEESFHLHTPEQVSYVAWYSLLQGMTKHRPVS